MAQKKRKKKYSYKGLVRKEVWLTPRAIKFYTEQGAPERRELKPQLEVTLERGVPEDYK